ncbi:hypothetical protein B0H14DRAFT_2609467 [Mycena olivaceomarginata]|nr:hypothetical protein B0H14DRAFT_2609467 [Mycena olivaceomarginata]
MDATTVLGTRVNEGNETKRDKNPEQAAGTQKGGEWGGPPMQNGPCVGVKSPKTGCTSAVPGNTICPLGKPEDRGWMEQPRARERASWGIKSPKTGCASAVPGNTICPLGKPEDRGWMGAAQGLRKGPCGV